ncbi:hypothetical protein PTSG_05816 [Salpingoeca rosetta]|uniref:Uncharacterized protein n=1 Tax=Salpingoeca rosetta (strain ATCC 50818 / BSB-021) TaxID=946362 RepID=F2UCV7_SALR5|nr:uncharacterized protein PTSG_05816 [Salpingoeca rosetta]EGD74452.1 hypothetical protein PTSG_05816 [Salpingoeca rosetta]|eukprot:XP_004992709.1 hypothetical protein PTSG_05816 [Salpingoeca rosetta]
MRERLLTTCEREFIHNVMKEGGEDGELVRLDGRGKSEMRRVLVTLGRQQYGQATASIGNTQAICRVSCSIVRPHEDRPTKGFVRYGVTLSPMASPDYDAGGRPSAASIYLTRLLEHIFREARALDDESLCIVAGEKVWAVSVNVTVTNDDGNMEDACALAALAGLMHFRRPYVSIAGQDVVVHPFDEHEPVSLAINHRPLNVTTALFDNGDLALVDPTKIELKVADGSISVAMNTHGEICGINSSEGLAVDPEQMEAIVAATKHRVTHLFTALNKAFPKE